MPTTAVKPATDTLASCQLQGNAAILASGSPLPGTQPNPPQRSLAPNPSCGSSSEEASDTSTKDAAASRSTAGGVEAAEADSEADMINLTDKVAKLWDAQNGKIRAVKKTQEQIKGLRALLAEGLHSLKGLHNRMGRNSRWSSTLRERGIPRATADRLVAAHEARLNPSVPAKPVDAASHVNLVSLAEKVACKVSTSLKTEAAVTEFLRELAVLLRAQGEEFYPNTGTKVAPC